MPSPFPGMDPWLESTRHFGDLHDSLIYNLQAAIQQQLPPFYVARKSLRIWLEAPQRPVEPDVYVVRSSRPSGDGGFPSIATLGETGPLVVTAEMPELEEETERFLDIYLLDGGDGRLVTSIEILSPSNKGLCGDGRTPYLKKQREMLESEVHLIEIDLLRGGLHTTAVPLHKLRRRVPKLDYHVCLHCFDKPPLYYIYPFTISDPLPEIAIPLLPGDPVLTIALQPLFDRSYDVGAFQRRIDYCKESPDPPLTEEQLAWSRGLIA